MSKANENIFVMYNSVCLKFGKSLWLLIAFACFGLNFVSAQLPKELYQSANELYKKNQFDSAAILYSELVKSDYDNAEVHFNFANALFKTNKLGESILHYEKALKFAPEDEDILHNLQLANRKTTDRIISVPDLKIIDWWKQFRKTFTSTGWGYLAIGFVWASFAFFALYLLTELRKTGFVFGVLMLLLSAFCFGLKLKQQKCETGPNTAILLASSVYVKSAPDEASTNLFTIHEGLKLQIKDRVGEWCKVRLADGKVGWIRKSEIGVI
jgi:tetratricopeptide (TPR) repeat protein